MLLALLTLYIVLCSYVSFKIGSFCHNDDMLGYNNHEAGKFAVAKP